MNIYLYFEIANELLRSTWQSVGTKTTGISSSTMSFRHRLHRHNCIATTASPAIVEL